MRTISKEKAYTIASAWGSYMHSGGPGACFYGFEIDDGRPQDDNHRYACLDYCDALLANTENHEFPKSHIQELKQLQRWFTFCPDVNGQFIHK